MRGILPNTDQPRIPRSEYCENWRRRRMCMDGACLRISRGEDVPCCAGRSINPDDNEKSYRQCVCTTSRHEILRFAAADPGLTYERQLRPV